MGCFGANHDRWPLRLRCHRGTLRLKVDGGDRKMPRTVLHTFILALLALSGAFGLSACSTKPEVPAAQAAVPALPPLYQVGAGDSLTIFVWCNAELTTTDRKSTRLNSSH